MNVPADRSVVVRAVDERWTPTRRIVEKLHVEHPEWSKPSIRAAIWNAVGHGELKLGWQGTVRRTNRP